MLRTREEERRSDEEEKVAAECQRSMRQEAVRRGEQYARDAARAMAPGASHVVWKERHPGTGNTTQGNAYHKPFRNKEPLVRPPYARPFTNIQGNKGVVASTPSTAE